jgi:hypothetical protein
MIIVLVKKKHTIIITVFFSTYPIGRGGRGTVGEVFLEKYDEKEEKG